MQRLTATAGVLCIGGRPLTGSRGAGGHLWEEALENGVSDRGICPSRGTSAKARMPTRGCRARLGGMCVYWGKLSTTQLIHFTNPTLPPPSILSFPPPSPFQDDEADKKA